jgi:hypothetical protein
MASVAADFNFVVFKRLPHLSVEQLCAIFVPLAPLVSPCR